MSEISGLLSESFASLAIRTANVREVEMPTGGILRHHPATAPGEVPTSHSSPRTGYFYLLLLGEARLQEKQGSPLATGSVVWFPPGNAAGHEDARDTALLCVGPCRWVEGTFAAGNAATSRLLDGLPACLHLGASVPGSSVPKATSIEHLLPLVTAELTADRLGSRAMINGALHLLFLETLRGCIHALTHNATGWFRASLDPDIGPVLLLLHARPEEPWTVATMAEQALMSRSSFAAKFNELVGEPPLQYLTKYRMDKARMLLCEESQPVKEIARTVGYISEAAFSTAFRRTEGMAPGSLRKIARLAGSILQNQTPAA